MSTGHEQCGAFLTEIDWRQPWLESVRETATTILPAPNWRDGLNAAAQAAGLRNHRGESIRFVPQACLPPGTAYEAFISASGCVPTRENLHDFFNALVWLTFPRIKVQLNALQAAEIARTEPQGASGTAVQKVRGRVRDAATLFDENAALLVVCDSELLDALRSHRWMEAFQTRRDAFGSTYEVWLFGHALMEKLVHPYKAITAHAWPVQVSDAFFRLSRYEKLAWINEAVSRQLTAGLTTSDFTPLPVLGVPEWWSGQDEGYYADAKVFRPKKRVKA